MIQGRSDVAVGSVVNRLLGGQQFDDGVSAPDIRACVGNSIQGFVVDGYRVRNHAGVATMTVEAVVKEFVTNQRITEIRHVVSEVEFLPKGFRKAVRVRVYRQSATVEMPYFYQTSHFALQHHARLVALEDAVLFGGPPASTLEGALARLQYVRLRERCGDPMLPEDNRAVLNALQGDLEHLLATP